MKVLVLGSTGMLGHAVLAAFAADKAFEAVGTARAGGALAQLPAALRALVRPGVDVEQPDALVELFANERPDVVINCVGVVKQLASADDPLTALPLNALLPHRLARLCRLGGARLIHVSTDCVFRGDRGGYRETDTPDAEDLYGRSKLLGEVTAPHTITLRTSIIGLELASAHGLVGWFLAQKDRVRGYRRAIFSGLPTVELAHVMRDVVVPNAALSGLYHVASSPISKYDLLNLVAQSFDKRIEIVPDDSVVIDRSLDGTRFATATGYRVAPWPELVGRMAAAR